MASSGEKHSPLEQFEIVPYFHIDSKGLDISFTNISLFIFSFVVTKFWV